MERIPKAHSSETRCLPRKAIKMPRDDDLRIVFSNSSIRGVYRFLKESRANRWNNISKRNKLKNTAHGVSRECKYDEQIRGMKIVKQRQRTGKLISYCFSLLLSGKRFHLCSENAVSFSYVGNTSCKWSRMYRRKSMHPISGATYNIEKLIAESSVRKSRAKGKSKEGRKMLSNICRVSVPTTKRQKASRTKTLDKAFGS